MDKVYCEGCRNLLTDSVGIFGLPKSGNPPDIIDFYKNTYTCKIKRVDIKLMDTWLKQVPEYVEFECFKPYEKNANNDCKDFKAKEENGLQKTTP
jgi:hypothetical protein